jgi:anti-sigma factor RsiW
LSEELLSLAADGLVDADAKAHLDACPACGDRLSRFVSVDAGLRSLPLASEPPPATLRATLRGMAAGDRPRRKWRSLPVAAAAALVAAVLVLSPTSQSVTEALAEEAISSHVRAFTTGDGSGCQVASEDPGALAHWLSDGLGMHVAVPAGGAGALVGARRCSLMGEEVAAVVYRTEEAPVTVFLPQPGGAAAAACERALGSCTKGRDGQTVCIVPDQAGSPRVVVGALPAERLCAVVNG